MGLINFSVEQLISARVHIGSSTKVWFSENYFFILGLRKGLFVLNLYLTVYNARIAFFLIEKVVFSGLQFCIVFQNPFLRQRVSLEMERYINYGLVYFVKKWLPGFFCNFKVFRNYFLVNLLRFERMSIDKKRLFYKKSDFKNYETFKGLRRCYFLPSLCCFLTLKNNGHGLAEATRYMIPVVALADSDIADLHKVTYVLPGNDDSMSGLMLFFIAFKNSFFVGHLKKRHWFLFLVNMAVKKARKQIRGSFFKSFFLLYFFLSRFIFFCF